MSPLQDDSFTSPTFSTKPVSAFLRCSLASKEPEEDKGAKQEVAAGLADAKHTSLSASLERVVVFTLQEEQRNGAQAFLRGQNVLGFFPHSTCDKKKKKKKGSR